MSILGSLIGAGSSIIGGLLGKDAAEDAAEKNMAAQMMMQARNEQLQREFAQYGIRWKVDDARAAGVHPLYALGAQSVSYQPTSIGMPYSGAGGAALGAGIAAAGQDLGRAVSATLTADERVQRDAMFQLQLKNQALQNDLLSSQISKINQAGGNPAFPSLKKGSGVQGDDDRSLQVFESAPKIVTPGREAQAQKVEDEYGEFAGDVSGGIRALRDTLRAHGVPLGKTPAEYSQALAGWLGSDAAKIRVDIVPGSPLGQLLEFFGAQYRGLRKATGRR